MSKFWKMPTVPKVLTSKYLDSREENIHSAWIQTKNLVKRFLDSRPRGIYLIYLIFFNFVSLNFGTQFKQNVFLTNVKTKVSMKIYLKTNCRYKNIL